MTQQEVNLAIQLALQAIAQFAGESGKTPQEILSDSNLLDDQVLARALAFQAELATVPPTP